MISLKSIQPFTPIHIPTFSEKEAFRKRKPATILCTANKSSGNSDEETPPGPTGDTRKQDLLARIAMLEAQKVQLTDYLDERSAYLTRFAEEANAEINQIGENALRELDEAGANIMENIESQMQSFEESMELNKLETEENEKKLADFESRIEEERNEGLFFKNLREKKPVDKEKAKEEARKVQELARTSAGSVARRTIYLGLIGLVVFGIIDATISITSDWRKISVLGVILIGLISQLVYEQSMLSNEKDKSEQKKENETMSE
ncbi:Unknown protein [Striga hermonthica]|uniref:8-amino-7-oxononanoate synthase n=1 Tax=Striga hermonthica TaxID=68872 RepID=A0A9N7NUG1_STRHE|nr:Unknown protein [Striga hermonthica]